MKMGRKPCSSQDHGDLKRGAWNADEDKILIDYIRVHGREKWSTLPQKAGLRRCGRSCRLRWMNYLRPDIKRGNISQDEEQLIIRLHNLLGNRWALIAGRLPGRTDNEIKNYWNTNLSKKVKNDHHDHHHNIKRSTFSSSEPSSPPVANYSNVIGTKAKPLFINNNNNPPLTHHHHPSPVLDAKAEQSRPLLVDVASEANSSNDSTIISNQIMQPTNSSSGSFLLPFLNEDDDDHKVFSPSFFLDYDDGENVCLDDLLDSHTLWG